jgi:hypothetical protein
MNVSYQQTHPAGGENAQALSIVSVVCCLLIAGSWLGVC